MDSLDRYDWLDKGAGTDEFTDDLTCPADVKESLEDEIPFSGGWSIQSAEHVDSFELTLILDSALQKSNVASKNLKMSINSTMYCCDLFFGASVTFVFIMSELAEQPVEPDGGIKSSQVDRPGVVNR